MTDNQTTELYNILDEFEHECFMLRVEASETRAKYDVVRKSYESIRDGFAGRIVAALVSDRESELQSALNKAAGNWAKADALLRELTSGTLTAEQVREAVMLADRWEKPMGNTGLTNTHLIIRDDGWQAIADELNAELGSGTCKNKATNMRTFWCDCCDCALEDWMDVGGKLVNGLRYCPNCGRKAEG